MKNINGKTLQAISLGAFLISLAAAFAAYKLLDAGIMVIFWVTALAYGIFLCFASGLRSETPGKFGPSDSMQTVAVGSVTALIGFLGLLYTAGADWIYIISALLAGVALIGITIALVNGRREESK